LVDVSKAVKDDSDEEEDEKILQKYNDDSCLDYIIGKDMLKAKEIAETKNTFRLNKVLNRGTNLLKKFNRIFRDWVVLFFDED